MSNRVLSRSLSVSTIADEESRGRLLNATPQPKSPPHDLYLACINPYRAPNTVVARPLQLDFGHAIRTPSSNSVLRSSDRLRPLTPVYTKTNPSAMFATSPASLDSPSLPTIRSPSHNSLNRLQSPSTPTAKTGRVPRPSSITQSSVPQRSPRSRKSSASRPGAPHPHGKPSVKHLTCFWWKEKGDCRFREEDCLYAHHDTGLYADPPRQVIPGGEFQLIRRPPLPHQSNRLQDLRTLLTCETRQSLRGLEDLLIVLSESSAPTTINHPALPKAYRPTSFMPILPPGQEPQE